MRPAAISHSRPTLGRAESDAVAKVIQGGHIAPGREVERFEDDFAGHCKGGSAAAVASGTAALHLCLLAMNVGSGDEVIIPSYVCTALLNAVRYVGASPVPADIDPASGNLDPADVKRCITRRTRVVIVPHLFGLPADMSALLSLGIPIIEDCAQAVGSTYQGQPAGSFGHAAVFSFYATKVITTGEGGMVVSSSRSLVDRVKDLREYDNVDVYRTRFNYKMTDMQAALGRVQLGRLNDFIEKRKAIAGIYRRALQIPALVLPPDDPGHIYFRFVVRLKKESDVLIKRLRRGGIDCARPVYRPIHRYLGLSGFVQTESAWRRSVSIPIYPSLSRQAADRVAAAVAAACGEEHLG